MTRGTTWKRATLTGAQSEGTLAPAASPIRRPRPTRRHRSSGRHSSSQRHRRGGCSRASRPRACRESPATRGRSRRCLCSPPARTSFGDSVVGGDSNGEGRRPVAARVSKTKRRSLPSPASVSRCRRSPGTRICVAERPTAPSRASSPSPLSLTSSRSERVRGLGGGGRGSVATTSALSRRSQKSGST